MLLIYNCLIFSDYKPFWGTLQFFYATTNKNQRKKNAIRDIFFKFAEKLLVL